MEFAYGSGNGEGRSARVFGFGDRPANNQVICSGFNRLSRCRHPRLVVGGPARRAHARHDDQELRTARVANRARLLAGSYNAVKP